MHMHHIYEVTSPNMPKTVYVGSTDQTEKARWGQHKCLKSNTCMSKHIVAAGGASLDVLETVTDPSVNLVDREFFYIMKFKEDGYTVFNKNMPGAVARAGGINAYQKQQRKDNLESYRARENKADARRLVPLACGRCGCMSSLMNLKQHQRTKRCQAAHQHQPTTVVNNITAHTVHVHNK
jgi:hypothetical protein